MYDRLLAEWIAAGRTNRQPHSKPSLSVMELMAAYFSWAQGYYRGGFSELMHIKLALRPLKALYDRTDADQFGPLALKAVRERMIQDGLCRNLINQRVGRIKRMFAWGVENELLSATVLHAMQAHGTPAAADLSNWCIRRLYGAAAWR